MKPKIRLLLAGGTIAEKDNGNGYLEECHQDYLHRVPGLDEIAQVVPMEVDNIDSTDMTLSHRIALAEEIYRTKDDFDGFVIAQGTDTMVSTAAALSYMLQGINKSIILTGSQVSIHQAGSDGPNNLYHAIAAATMDVNEVAIAFGNHLLKGNRAVKISSTQRDAFATPNVENLGRIDLGITLNQESSSEYSKPKLFTDFSTKIVDYEQVSGSHDTMLKYCADSQDVEGVIISGFGVGNVQSKKIDDIKALVSLGKPVVVTTNCLQGTANLDLYRVGVQAKEAGVIPAYDMTREAAQQKLMYSLGLANSLNLQGSERIEYVRDVFHTPVNNDISLPKKAEVIELGDRLCVG